MADATKNARSGAAVFLPPELLEKLGPLAERMGINLPEETRFAATIDASQPIRALAHELGQMVQRRNIFLRAGAIITVADHAEGGVRAGETKPMTAERFCGWIEEFCVIKGERGRNSLSRETAALVLAQDIFREHLRPIDAVHLVRLPVRRESGAVELLPAGYDNESRILTIETLSYDYDYPVQHAGEFFGDLLADYPWGDGEKTDVMTSRSAAVQVVSMLGLYCRALFPPRTKRPIIVTIGNQVGTGKSTLAAMGMITVFGQAASTDLPSRTEELEKTLATKAFTMAPYLFFDDVGIGVFSNALNRFVTATVHTGRLLGGNKEFSADNVTQVFITGNALKASPDLMRRSLVCELFLAEESKGRKFARVINDAWLERTENRQFILASLWAAVRAWIQAGMPLHPTPRESFEEWTETIAGIVQQIGFADPLSTAELVAGGDQSTIEWTELLVSLANDVETGTKRDYTRKEIIERARYLGVLENLVGSTDDGDVIPTDSRKFGRQLEPWKGRVMNDSKGRRFTFSPVKARDSQKKLYPCVVDADPPA